MPGQSMVSSEPNGARRPRPQTIATSLRRCGEPGSSLPARGVDHAHRVLDGDELLAGGGDVAFGAAQARQDQRLAAVVQVRAVQLGRMPTVRPHVLHRRGGHGRCRAWPRRSCRRDRRTRRRRRRAWPASTSTVSSRARAAARSRTRRGARRGTSSGICSQIPIVRSPWTLLCPRMGDAPAPGRPMLPRSSRKLTISRMVATALLVLGQPHRPADDDAVVRPRRGPPTPRSSRGSGRCATRWSAQSRARPGADGFVVAVGVVVDEVAVDRAALAPAALLSAGEERQVAVEAHRTGVRRPSWCRRRRHRAPTAGCGTGSARPRAAG